jgi:hypothetical protein
MHNVGDTLVKIFMAHKFESQFTLQTSLPTATKLTNNLYKCRRSSCRRPKSLMLFCDELNSQIPEPLEFENAFILPIRLALELFSSTPPLTFEETSTRAKLLEPVLDRFAAKLRPSHKSVAATGVA